MTTALRHVGIGIGRIDHWHDGLGEYSRQLSMQLAAQAEALRREHGIALHFHLPRRWHGEFGDEVGYLDTHTTQRWLHPRLHRFALWHTLHQHNRLKAPWRTGLQVETVHDLNFLRTKRGAKLHRYRVRLGRRLAGRDRVVAISHHAAQDLHEQLPTLTAPVQVIHNGVTDLTAAPQRTIDGLADRPFLLHISRMAPTKNVVALLGLAAIWPERRFVLAGASSPYIREVERGIVERGLSNVSLRLDIDEAQKAWAYAHCDGFLFPSLTEGFGLPPLEAMHFGKPAFLSRLTSLPEVGGDAAFYFDGPDAFEPHAMKRVVEAGLREAADPRVGQRIVAQARGFSWQRSAAAYIAMYLGMLA